MVTQGCLLYSTPRPRDTRTVASNGRESGSYVVKADLGTDPVRPQHTTQMGDGYCGSSHSQEGSVPSSQPILGSGYSERVVELTVSGLVLLGAFALGVACGISFVAGLAVGVRRESRRGDR